MASSTEQNFRSNLSQFAWARGVTDDSAQHSQQPAQSGNAFSRFYNTVAGDYVPLRSSERSNEEEAWFALSRWESLGSLLVMLGYGLPISPVLRHLIPFLSFSVLIGPINHLKHLVSKERLPFTFIYFLSLGLTLYFSLGLHSFLGSLISGIVQIVALVAYVLAYFPGGTQTLRMGGSLALRGAGSLLPR
uniref:Protein transport protein SFT2 n=1 Tax=Moniliophthora roreri TaxID=221103 RepID=A0A0W0G1N6_MONRR